MVKIKFNVPRAAATREDFIKLAFDAMTPKEANHVRRQIEDVLKAIRPRPASEAACRQEIENELLLSWDYDDEGGPASYQKPPLKEIKAKVRKMRLPLVRALRAVRTFPGERLFGPDEILTPWEHEKLSLPELRRLLTLHAEALIAWCELVEGIKGKPSGGASADRLRWAARTAFKLMLVYAEDNLSAFDARPKRGRLARLAEELLGRKTRTVDRYVREEVARQNRLALIEQTMIDVSKGPGKASPTAVKRILDKHRRNRAKRLRELGFHPKQSRK